MTHSADPMAAALHMVTDMFKHSQTAMPCTGLIQFVSDVYESSSYTSFARAKALNTYKFWQAHIKARSVALTARRSN